MLRKSVSLVVCVAAVVALLVYIHVNFNSFGDRVDHGVSAIIDDMHTTTANVTHPMQEEGAFFRMENGDIWFESGSSRMELFTKEHSGLPADAPSGMLVIDLNMDGYEDVGILKEWSAGFGVTSWEYFLADNNPSQPFFSIGQLGRATTFPDRQQVMLEVAAEPFVSQALYDASNGGLTRIFTREHRDGYDLLRLPDADDGIPVGLAVSAGHTMLDIERALRDDQLHRFAVQAELVDEHVLLAGPSTKAAQLGVVRQGDRVNVVSNTLDGQWLQIAFQGQGRSGDLFWLPKAALAFEFSLGS